jgi:hypothetical protein
MQVLGALLDYFMERAGKTLTILIGTSGDTGSAGIEAGMCLDVGIMQCQYRFPVPAVCSTWLWSSGYCRPLPSRADQPCSAAADDDRCPALHATNTLLRQRAHPWRGTTCDHSYHHPCPMRTRACLHRPPCTHAGGGAGISVGKQSLYTTLLLYLVPVPPCPLAVDLQLLTPT